MCYISRGKCLFSHLSLPPFPLTPSLPSPSLLPSLPSLSPSLSSLLPSLPSLSPSLPFLSPPSLSPSFPLPPPLSPFLPPQLLKLKLPLNTPQPPLVLPRFNTQHPFPIPCIRACLALLHNFANMEQKKTLDQTIASSSSLCIVLFSKFNAPLISFYDLIMLYMILYRQYLKSAKSAQFRCWRYFTQATKMSSFRVCKELLLLSRGVGAVAGRLKGPEVVSKLRGGEKLRLQLFCRNTPRHLHTRV